MITFSLFKILAPAYCLHAGRQGRQVNKNNIESNVLRKEKVMLLADARLSKNIEGKQIVDTRCFLP